MDTQDFTINNMTFHIPDYYYQVEPLPDDPIGSISFVVNTPYANCFVQVKQLQPEEAIPFDKEVVIDSVRSFLSENQGIIRVESGNYYIYTIDKCLNTSSQRTPPDGFVDQNGRDAEWED